MKKNLLLYILLFFLIGVNGFFLYNYIGKPNNVIRDGKQEDFVVKELEFNTLQKQKYEQLEAEHRKKMRLVLNELQELKDVLFDKVSNKNINEIDSLATRIGKIEKEKELETFYHLRAIENICDEKQKEKFILIIKEALHRSTRGAKGPPSNNRGREDGRRPPPPPRQ